MKGDFSMKKVVLLELLVVLALIFSLDWLCEVYFSVVEKAVIAAHMLTAVLIVHWYARLWERAFCVKRKPDASVKATVPYCIMTAPYVAVFAVAIMSCGFCLGDPLPLSFVLIFAMSFGGFHICLEHVLMKIFRLKKNSRYQLFEFSFSDEPDDRFN